AEHRTADELKARIFGDAIVYTDIDNSILENNLFGVDINEDAIEIAKLSLWLHTAKKGRKLSNLSNNIKAGNSLIDDESVAGEKAFKWKDEFKRVFDKGGFDVVIGNPPYLRVQGLRENFENETNYYEKSFVAATGRFDLYILFIEKSYSLINAVGEISFILPHKFMISDFGEGIRDFLIKRKAVKSIVSFGAEMVFDDASTYTCIVNLKSENRALLYKEVKPQLLLDESKFKVVSYESLSSEKWNLQDEEGNQLFDKLNKQPLKAKDVFEYISQGIVSVGDEIFMMEGKIVGERFRGFSTKLNKEVEIESKLIKPILKGDDVKKYSTPVYSNYIIYPHKLLNNKTVPLEEKELQENFPLTYDYLLNFKEELIGKKIRYKTNPKFWYSLHRAREIQLFEQSKIITPETSFGTNMTLDDGNHYHNTQVYSFIVKKGRKEEYKFLLSLLNSTLMWYFLKNTGTVLRGGFFRFKTSYLENFPIPIVEEINQKPFLDKVDVMISNNKALDKILPQLSQLLKAKFNSLNINNKLQSWPSLTANEFLKELEKQKIKLSLSEQQDWLQYFAEQKAKANNIQQVIKQTDKEIDDMVYELYGLSEDERGIVEGR
ncbi:MAG TPA: TaqI-like C-terminal specificity domain-containing protein, partial [Segetibacter sp.]